MIVVVAHKRNLPRACPVLLRYVLMLVYCLGVSKIIVDMYITKTEVFLLILCLYEDKKTNTI